MTSKYFPLSDWMVIEPDVSKVSNLILPDGADDPSKDESRVFIVKRVGPGYWDMNQWIEPKVHEGDKILVAGFAIGKVIHDGRPLYLARARDVVVIIQTEEEVN